MLSAHVIQLGNALQLIYCTDRDGQNAGQNVLCRVVHCHAMLCYYIKLCFGQVPDRYVEYVVTKKGFAPSNAQSHKEVWWRMHSVAAGSKRQMFVQTGKISCIRSRYSFEGAPKDGFK